MSSPMHSDAIGLLDIALGNISGAAEDINFYLNTNENRETIRDIKILHVGDV